MQELLTMIIFFFIIFLILSVIFKYLWPLFLILFIVTIFNSWRSQKRRETIFKDMFNEENNTNTNRTPPNFNPSDVIDVDYKERDLD